MQKLNTQNNFDILRLVLALLVFFAHWNTLTSQNISHPLFHLSGYAVHMFFIISGFLIFWSFDADQNKKHFYIKRFFRIFPLYAFLIILQTIFFISFSNGSLEQIVKYFVSNIVFLGFFMPSVGNTFSSLEVNAINGSLWTLKNEVVFYIFLPLVYILYKKWKEIFLIIVYALSVFYMFFIDYIVSLEIVSRHHGNILLFQFPALLRLFIVGILLYVFFQKFKNKNIYFLSIGSLILLILFEKNLFFQYTLYPFCIGFIMIYMVYFIKYIKINFDFSYSLYIVHFPVIQIFLFFNLNSNNSIISFVSLLSIILVLSYLSEKFIEKRFIKYGKDLIKKNRIDE